MSERGVDLALVCIWALAALPLTLAGGVLAGLRGIVGLGLALMVPGYALVAALFPARRSLLPADRLLLSLGLSLFATIGLGFLLHITPWGLSATAWALGLGGVTWVASLVAQLRRRRWTIEHPEELRWLPKLSMERHHALMGTASALILTAALWLGISQAYRQPPEQVLQLWLHQAPGHPSALVVGVNSEGTAQGSFKLQILRGGYLLREWPALDIRPGERWEQLVELSATTPGSGPIEARLYPHENPTQLERTAHFWPRGAGE